MKYVLLITMLLLAGCAEHKEQISISGIDGKDGKDGESCTITENAHGSTLTCGSQSTDIQKGLGIIGPIHLCNENRNYTILRLSDGSILSISNLGRGSFLTPGTFGLNMSANTPSGLMLCTITIDNNLNVTTTPIPATGAVNN